MPTYMLILADDESWHDQRDDEARATLKLHQEFTEAVEAAGAKILGGEALDRSSTATTVRNPSDGGAALVTDGPFIESKEVIGGFYVIAARDLDQALDFARRCPSPVVEVRPVLDFSNG